MPHRIALDQPQAYPDHHPEGAIQKELDQEQPAEARRGVVECGGGALQVIRPRQPDEPITEILSLQQNKDDENDDNAGRRQRMKQRRDQGSQALQRARIGLAHLDRNGRERRRSFETRD